MMCRRRFVSATMIFASSVVLTSGCSRSNRDYTPSSLTAEGALRAGLDAWKAELPVGPVPDTNPIVHVVDMNRKPDQRLKAYKILGEKAVPSGRTFTVVLELEEPTEEVRTYYHVVGIDPLWVFRKEDYELLSHWDHYMPPDEEQSKEESPAAEAVTEDQPAPQSSADES
jgi:hypothetical protein